MERIPIYLLFERAKIEAKENKKGRSKTSGPKRSNRLALAPFAALFTIAAATAHRRTVLAWTGDIDRQLPALEFFVVEHLHRLGGIGRRGVLDKSKSARFAREFVQHQVD